MHLLNDKTKVIKLWNFEWKTFQTAEKKRTNQLNGHFDSNEINSDRMFFLVCQSLNGFIKRQINFDAV